MMNLKDMLTHKGEKPYQCTLCENKFSRNDEFTRHMLTHTGEKPYQCNQCDKAFKLKKGLNRHLKNQ